MFVKVFHYVSFADSFIQYSLSTYHVPDTVLCSGETVVKKKRQNLYSHKLIF